MEWIVFYQTKPITVVRIFSSRVTCRISYSERIRSVNTIKVGGNSYWPIPYYLLNRTGFFMFLLQILPSPKTFLKRTRDFSVHPSFTFTWSSPNICVGTSKFFVLGLPFYFLSEHLHLSRQVSKYTVSEKFVCWLSCGVDFTDTSCRSLCHIYQLRYKCISPTITFNMLKHIFNIC